MFAKLGLGEIVVILVVALLVFGPDKLPQAGRAAGKAIKSVKKYIHEATDELKDAIGDVDELENEIKDVEQELTDAAASASEPVHTQQNQT